MKKSISKLALKRETVRTLVSTELTWVVGGQETACPALTRLQSGCSEEFHADSLVPPPDTK
jgi:hypothetical protein